MSLRLSMYTYIYTPICTDGCRYSYKAIAIHMNTRIHRLHASTYLYIDASISTTVCDNACIHTRTWKARTWNASMPAERLLCMRTTCYVVDIYSHVYPYTYTTPTYIRIALETTYTHRYMSVLYGGKRVCQTTSVSNSEGLLTTTRRRTLIHGRADRRMERRTYALLCPTFSTCVTLHVLSLFNHILLKGGVLTAFTGAKKLDERPPETGVLSAISLIMD